jgi:hypothetical protein
MYTAKHTILLLQALKARQANEKRPDSPGTIIMDSVRDVSPIRVSVTHHYYYHMYALMQPACTSRASYGMLQRVISSL